MKKAVLVILSFFLLAACSGKKNIDRKQLPDFTGQSAEESEIYVAKIDGLSNDFIRGADVSSYVAEKESGIKYYDYSGKELNDEEFFSFLGECGINCIRIRIWNDPYDTKGNSYGGGHNDVETAVKIGKLATAAGMKVLIDFHYSDFWADPSKQMAPKKWAHLTFDDKLKEMDSFTREALTRLYEEDIEVYMVQIGNEINSGLAGETSEERIYALLQKASGAVRDTAKKFNKEVKIAVHYANPHHRKFDGYCDKLIKNNVDFDVFGVSYYPYWHSTVEKLQNTLQLIRETYNKDVMVMETSYVYTDEDGDGFANSISSDTSGVELPYEISVQGQANEVKAVAEAVHSAGGLGLCYWEIAWLPVGTPDQLQANQQIWEKYGSGWASSFAGTYDRKDAGEYYGGSSWDNQALFDFKGNPLASLKIYKYLYTGTLSEKKTVAVRSLDIESGIGEPITVPDQIEAIMNDSSVEKKDVVWDQSAIDAINVNVAGDYRISGKSTIDGKVWDTEAVIHILKVNYVKNAGFEEHDFGNWVINKGDSIVDVEEGNNAHSEKACLHFYSTDNVVFDISQKIEGIPSGTYEYSAFLQGGDSKASDQFELYIQVNGREYTAASGVTSWQAWSNPTIKDVVINENDEVIAGFRVNASPKCWGAWDDFSLTKQ